MRVRRKAGLLGEGQAVAVEVPATVRTGRQILAAVRHQLPQSTEVGIAVDGRLLTGDELDQPLADGADVLVAAAPHGLEIGAMLIQALVSAVVAAAVGYLITLLFPPPKPPGLPQDRGDQSSSTYAWDGMATSYGQGLSIPIVYGRHFVAGQVIYASVFATTAGGQQPLAEYLRTILVLCEGPIARVGDQTARTVDGLGGFAGGFGGSGGAIPQFIRVNNNALDHTNPLPGAKVWLRRGDLDQTALPTNPFTGAVTTFTVGDALNEIDQESVFSYVGTEEIAHVSVIVSFPGGLYQQDSQGNLTPYPVTFDLEWRQQGVGVWSPLFVVGTSTPRTSWTIGQVNYNLAPEVGTIGGNLFPDGASVYGPIEVRVRRRTASGGQQVVSQAVFRQAMFAILNSFAYPGVALCGFELLATGNSSGSMPQFKVRTDGALVRVWDAANGWSPRCWDVPAAPWNFHTYAPGRNPAWIAVDFVLARWGLGPWFDESMLDLPAFRRWAHFCDGDPNPGSPWGEPAFTCDLVIDTAKPAWEVLLQICNCGRATPVWRNGKLSVVYQYRDAHGGGTVSVPAKSVTQLFTSGNVEDLQVNWLPKAERPTVVQFQFLNENNENDQDTLTVEDPALVGVDQLDPDTFRVMEQQAYGVTRPSQLQREGVFIHALQRQVRREITFKAGPWALASEVGDLIDVEHDILRPFGTDVPLAMQVLAVSGSTITVDHVVSGTGLEVVVRDPSGAPVRRDVTGTLAVSGGTRLTLTSAVTVNVGAACAVGKKDKLTQTYEMVSVSLAEDVKREVKAIEWTPTAYDPLVPGAGTDAPPAAQPEQQSSVDTDWSATDLRVDVLGGRGHRISWAKHPSRRDGACRVFVQLSELGAWFLLGETRQTFLDHGGFRTWAAYTIAVVAESAGGAFGPPESGLQLSFTAEEFPRYSPPAVTGLSVQQTAAGVVVRWTDAASRDVEGCELRVGRHWHLGRPVFRGSGGVALLSSPPAAAWIQAAFRSLSGLYGSPVKAALGAWSPAGSAAVASRDELASHAGTFTGTQWDATLGAIVLSAGVLSGTYESAELDVTYVAPSFWSVLYDAEEANVLEVVGDLGIQVGSGEARWRTLGGRPASPGLPGIDWSKRISDLAMPIGDVPKDLQLAGPFGTAGSHTLCRVESRTYDGSSWSAYAEHSNRVVAAQKLQVRITLARRSTAWRVAVTELTLGAYL